MRGSRHEQEGGVGNAAHDVGQALVAHDFAQRLHQELQAVITGSQTRALAELARMGEAGDFDELLDKRNYRR